MKEGTRAALRPEHVSSLPCDLFSRDRGGGTFLSAWGSWLLFSHQVLKQMGVKCMVSGIGILLLAHSSAEGI